MKIENEEIFKEYNIFGKGKENSAYAKYFTGTSFLNPLNGSKDSLTLYNVTFEPGCRNNYHIHHAKSGGGQIIICVAGEGWYQEEGKEAISLVPGTVITVLPNVKHWHGAKRIVGFHTLHLKYLVKNVKTNGVRA